MGRMRAWLLPLLLIPASGCAHSQDPVAVRALQEVATLKLDEEGFVVGVDTFITPGATRSLTDFHLSLLPDFPRLRKVVLADASITDSGLRHVARIPALEDLDIALCTISDAGLAHLHEATSLRKLRVSLTHVTDAGLKRLRRALPDCQVN